MLTTAPTVATTAGDAAQAMGAIQATQATQATQAGEAIGTPEAPALFAALTAEFCAARPGRTEALRAQVALLALWFLRQAVAPRA